MSQLEDLDYLSSRNELAIVTGLIQGMLEGDCGDAGDHTVIELIEQRRKLADTEIKRVKLAQDTLTREQAKAFGAALLEAVRRHVRDMQVVQAIQDDVRSILSTMAG